MFACWLALVAAGQQELSARAALHEAMAEEVIHGDLDGAARRYLRMSRNRATDPTTRAETLFFLGRAMYDLGRIDLAREALLEGIRSGVCAIRCRDLLETLEIDLESVTTVPTRWTFDETDHGFFHPGAVQDLGAIKLGQAPDGDRALAWSTSPQARRPDRLVIGLKRPNPAPSLVSVRITSETLDAILQLVVEDEAGHRYSLPQPRALPAGRSRTLELPLAQLIPLQPGTPPLDPTRLTRLALIDLTGARTSGDNTLWIHDFALR
ncbi:MAG TPA: hypothetical protein ENK18_04415 [Deltaproteobacteria bacterium]|nr:hypothetical protein [Deltaproteobacteria bacterium]